MYKHLWAVLLIGASMLAGSGREAEAGLLGSPLGLRATVERIRFSEAALAPMAYTMFCMRYAGECGAPRRMIFRGGATRMTRERMAELMQVNTAVNRGTSFRHPTRGAWPARNG